MRKSAIDLQENYLVNKKKDKRSGTIKNKSCESNHQKKVIRNLTNNLQTPSLLLYAYLAENILLLSNHVAPECVNVDFNVNVLHESIANCNFANCDV